MNKYLTPKQTKDLKSFFQKRGISQTEIGKMVGRSRVRVNKSFSANEVDRFYKLLAENIKMKEENEILKNIIKEK